MTRSLFLTLIFLTGFVQSAHPQHAGYKLYTVADGLVQSEVVAIHQDKKGFLWIGTKNGISRFDGNTFQRIDDPAHVSRSAMRFVDDLNDSTVFMVTGNGYILFEYGKFARRITSGPISGHILGSWVADGKGQFVIMNDTSVALYEVDRHGIRKIGHSFLDYMKDLVYPGQGIPLAYSPKDRNIYFRNKSGRLCCIRGYRRIELPIGSFQYLYTGRDGYAYCITPEEPIKKFLSRQPVRHLRDVKKKDLDPVKLYRITDTVATCIQDFGDDQTALVCPLSISGQDDYTLMDYKNNKLIRYGKHQPISVKYDLPLAGVIYDDDEGNRWIACRQGLIREFPSCFESFTEKEGLNPDSHFIVEDRLGKMVTGSYDQGIQILKDGKFTQIPIPNDMSREGNIIFYPGGRADHRGIVHLCGHPYGAVYWDGEKLKAETDFPINCSMYFYEDPQDFTDYYGTTVGLIVKPEDRPYRLMEISPGNQPNHIVSIVRDGLGRIILGGFQGISILDGQKVIHLPDKQFDYNSGANAMVRDDRKNVWIGNNDGLWLFDNMKFRKIVNPWFNDLIVSLRVVDSATLFIGGLRGIGFLDLQRFYSHDTAVIRYFDSDNGFSGLECQQNAVTLSRTGMIWVATTNSIVRIDPCHIPKSTEGPRIYISEVSVIDAGMRKTVVACRDISHGYLELAPLQTNLRFNFTCLFFRAPSRTKYRYMLQGHETAWSAPTNERFATYTNLKPGKYTFKVLACNDEGMWSKIPATLSILIKPAIWQTWWFMAILALCSILFVSGITWLVFRRIRRKKQQEFTQQKIVAELQFKTLRNQLAPHFIFNSLNSIGSSIYRNDPAASYDLLHKFSKLIRHTLTHADKTSRTLAEEVEFAQYYLEIEKIRFEGRINYDIKIGPDVSFDMQVPRMIIQTFVENAVKHGLMHKEGNGHIEIEIRNNGAFLEIRVEDDGIGRAAAEQFRGDSTGKGMEIIREFIRLFNSFNDEKIEVEIEDRTPEADGTTGTRVRVKVPLTYTYKLIDEIPVSG
jgi:two-component sensor histidine kinase